MVITNLQIEDKVGRSRFFQKTFLIIDTKFDIILRMPFLKLSNENISFDERTLMQKTFITNEALFITKQVQIIDKKYFIIAILDANNKTFVVHMAIWEQEKMPIYFKKQAQIKAQIRALLFNIALIEVLVEYSDYSDIFLAEYVVEFPKNTGINEHAIK